MNSLADENVEIKSFEVNVPTIGERQSPDGQEEPKSDSNLGSKSCGI